MKTRIWVVAILVLSFFGLADSSYLAEHALTGTPLLCNIQNLSGCNIVAGSQYSHLFGVPLAVYGVVFYGLLFVLSALELVIFDRLLRRALQIASVAGFLASVYFVLVQVFLIGAFCIYCFISALIALVTLVAASFIEPIKKREDAPPPPTPTPMAKSDTRAKTLPKGRGVPLASPTGLSSANLKMPPEA